MKKKSVRSIRESGKLTKGEEERYKKESKYVIIGGKRVKVSPKTVGGRSDANLKYLSKEASKKYKTGNPYQKAHQEKVASAAKKETSKRVAAKSTESKNLAAKKAAAKKAGMTLAELEEAIIKGTIKVKLGEQRQKILGKQIKVKKGQIKTESKIEREEKKLKALDVRSPSSKYKTGKMHKQIMRRQRRR